METWGGILYSHVPGLHVFRKLIAAEREIKNNLPVLYATDDDLFGYSAKDVEDFIKSDRHYSASRQLIFRIITTQNGQRGFHFWEGWKHCIEASLVSSPAERLRLFGGEGLGCFYGLFSRKAFRLRALQTAALMDAIGDTQNWSIIEDLTNLATQSLTWHSSYGSWCFRFLGRAFHVNKGWRPSWVALEEMREKEPTLLKSICEILAKWIYQNTEICGSSEAVQMNEGAALELIAGHTRGYQSAQSRKWRGGKDYIYVPGQDPDRVSFILFPEDPDRPFFIIPRPLVVSELDRALFNGEWIVSSDALSLFNIMSDDFINLKL